MRPSWNLHRGRYRPLLPLSVSSWQVESEVLCGLRAVRALVFRRGERAGRSSRTPIRQRRPARTVWQLRRFRRFPLPTHMPDLLGGSRHGRCGGSSTPRAIFVIILIRDHTGQLFIDHIAILIPTPLVHQRTAFTQRTSSLGCRTIPPLRFGRPAVLDRVRRRVLLSLERRARRGHGDVRVRPGSVVWIAGPSLRVGAGRSGQQDRRKRWQVFLVFRVEHRGRLVEE